MKKCGNCNTELGNQASFCHVCGAECETSEDFSLENEDISKQEEVEITVTAIKKHKTKKQMIFTTIILMAAVIGGITIFAVIRTPNYEKPIKMICEALQQESLDDCINAYLEECKPVLVDTSVNIGRRDFLNNKFLDRENSKDTVIDVKYKIKEVIKANKYSLENFTNMMSVSYDTDAAILEGYYIYIDLTVKTVADEYQNEVYVIVGKTDNGWGCLDWSIDKYDRNNEI